MDGWHFDLLNNLPTLDSGGEGIVVAQATWNQIGMPFTGIISRCQPGAEPMDGIERADAVATDAEPFVKENNGSQITRVAGDPMDLDEDEESVDVEMTTVPPAPSTVAQGGGGDGGSNDIRGEPMAVDVKKRPPTGALGAWRAEVAELCANSQAGR